jgi:hypothetical protein
MPTRRARLRREIDAALAAVLDLARHGGGPERWRRQRALVRWCAGAGSCLRPPGGRVYSASGLRGERPRPRSSLGFGRRDHAHQCLLSCRDVLQKGARVAGRTQPFRADHGRCRAGEPRGCPGDLLSARGHADLGQPPCRRPVEHLLECVDPLAFRRPCLIAEVGLIVAMATHVRRPFPAGLCAEQLACRSGRVPATPGADQRREYEDRVLCHRLLAQARRQRVDANLVGSGHTRLFHGW